MVNLEYYGHSCVRLDDGESRVLFDPFLTGNPKASLRAEEVEADFILVSHAHSDHLGDAAEIAARTGAKVIGVPEVVALCRSQVEDQQLIGMNLGGMLELPFGKVRLVPALHSSGAAGAVACGFVVKMGGFVIYFAGDTCLFSDMKYIGRREPIDYALLPIGDFYTMGPEDAALAAKWLGARHVIPIHYGTLPVIEQNPEKFKAFAAAKAPAVVDIVRPGEHLELR